MFWSVLFSCCWLGTSSAPLSLEGAIQNALKNNLEYQSVIEKRTQVQGGIQEAKSAAFPRVTMKSSYSETRSPSLLNSKDFEDFIAQFPDGNFSPQVQPLHTLSVEVKQPLFTWGRVKSAIELADIVAMQTEHEIDNARLSTAHQTASAYLTCLSAKEALEVERKQAEIRKDALDLVQIRLELGQATQLDYLKAKSSLAELDPNLLQRESDLQLAYRRLARIMRQPDLGTPKLTSVEMTLIDPPPLDALISTALRIRPDLLEIGSQQNSLEKQEVIQKTVGLPNLEFNGNYGREALYASNLDDPRFNSWRASIDFSWTLFDGFEKKGKLAQIRSQIRQTELQKQDLLSQIRFDIDQARMIYATAIRTVEASQHHLDAANEALRVAEVQYKEGTALQLDWSDAQQQARSSEMNKIIAELNARQSLLNLKRAIGLSPLKPLLQEGVTP